MIDLPRSTFYYQPTATTADVPDVRLVELIGEIQDDFPGDGYPRVTHELRRRGVALNHKRVSRVMKAHGMGIRPRRRFVRTTDSDHDLPVFPNLYRNIRRLRAVEDLVDAFVISENARSNAQRRPPRTPLSFFYRRTGRMPRAAGSARWLNFFQR